MTLKPWKKVSSKIIHENKFLTLRQDDFSLPNDVSVNYFYLDVSDAVEIIPVNASGKLLLVKQYRPLAEQMTYEFPAGGVKKGQTVQEAAELELREEANVTGKFEYMGKFQPANARLNEWMHVFIAHELSESFAPKDEAEDFEQIQWSVEEFETKIAEGGIVDGTTLAAWVLSKSRILEILNSQGTR